MERVQGNSIPKHNGETDKEAIRIQAKKSDARPKKAGRIVARCKQPSVIRLEAGKDRSRSP
jgi:hypothetical protein